MISQFDYRYDNTANRVGVTEASGDRVTWTYDASNQLTRERRSGVNGYDATHVYDPAGNRTLKRDGGSRTTTVYNGANRIVSSQDGSGRTTITYDADGNLTKEVKPSGQITTSVWDAENMNGAVLLPDTTRVTYTYNGNHQRVRKDAAGGTRKYVYNLENLLTETDAGNVTQAVYTQEPVEYGNLVSQRQLGGASWNSVYYHYDALGSTDSLSDGMAVVTDTYTYTAFGETRASTGTTTNLFTWVGELGYVRDTETGEYGLRERQYQPDKERFKSEDRAGFDPDPISLYRYVGNNAVNAVDPSGLDEVSVGEPEYNKAGDKRYPVWYVEGDGKPRVLIGHTAWGAPPTVVRRGCREVPMSKVESEVWWWGTTSDWESWFKANGDFLNYVERLSPSAESRFYYQLHNARGSNPYPGLVGASVSPKYMNEGEARYAQLKQYYGEGGGGGFMFMVALPQGLFDTGVEGCAGIVGMPGLGPCKSFGPSRSTAKVVVIETVKCEPRKFPGMPAEPPVLGCRPPWQNSSPPENGPIAREPAICPPNLGRSSNPNAILSQLQSVFDALVETDLLPRYRAIDSQLRWGYTGSFRTGNVGNRNKPTSGEPIDLSNFDIDFWIESDILFRAEGPNDKADVKFRKILYNTPGFEGLRPNKKGFSIRFKPSSCQ